LKKRVIWHRPGALGDVLMTLQLVHEYRKQNPGVHLTYKAHPSTLKHLEGLIRQAGFDDVMSTEQGLAGEHQQINLIGYPLAEGYPEKPMKRHLLDYFGAEVGLPEGLATAHLPLSLPPKDLHIPYCTMHIKAGWSMYKEWPIERWQEVATHLTRKLGIPIFQVGGPEDPLLTDVHDFRGRSFLEGLQMLGGAAMHLGIDSWSNHATNIDWIGKGKTKAVILWGSTQPSAAGYAHNLNIQAGLPCQPCFREDPKISRMSRGVCPHPGGQTYEKPQHECMAKIQVATVLTAAIKLWGERQQ